VPGLRLCSRTHFEEVVLLEQTLQKLDELSLFDVSIIKFLVLHLGNRAFDD
jgi:hypothetical protein